MGMFDTVNLQGRVAEDAKKHFGAKDLNWQTKCMDLELTEYYVGDDLNITGLEFRHEGIEYEEPSSDEDSFYVKVRDGKFTNFIEFRYEMNYGTLVMKFIDNKLQWIAHMQMCSYPLREHTKPGTITDKFIIYGENGEASFHTVDHASNDTSDLLMQIKSEAVAYMLDGFI